LPGTRFEHTRKTVPRLHCASPAGRSSVVLAPRSLIDRRCRQTVAFSKHARQRTGRPWFGRNGTVVAVPHSAQIVRVSGRVRGELAARLALHSLQCLGSLANCFAWKNRCSSAVKTKSFPQTTHFNTRSENSISGFLMQASPEAVKSAQAARWPIARIKHVNSRLGPEPHQISSGDSKDCAVYRQAGIVHRAFCGVARWVKRSMD